MRKAVTLVIVVMLMVVLAVMGATILQMQSIGFSRSQGVIDSERALYLAEAGAQYAVKELSEDISWRPSPPVRHYFDKGEYEIIVRDPIAGTKEENGDVVVESTGYIPSKDNYRARRTVRLILVVGNIDKVVQVRNLFDWSDAGQDIHTKINDDIAVGIEGAGYEGDGDDIHNELGVDYGDGVPPQRGDRIFIPQSSIPDIDMDYFRTHARKFFPNPLGSRPMTATITGIIGSNTIEVNRANFFDDMEEEALKNTKIDGWGDDAWRVISSVPGGYNGRRAQLESSVSGIWHVGDKVRLVKRFHESLPLIHTFLVSITRYWYIDTDVIIDARYNNVYRWYTSIVATGDIVITGDNKVSMRAHLLFPSYPLFATKDGDIISFPPQTGNDQIKMKKRAFYGMIYTQNGDMDFNYLYGIVGWWRGVELIANNLYLRGRVQIDYSSYFVDDYGFDFKPSALYWQEK